MFWGKKPEKNRLFESCVSVNGTNVGDGFFFTFAQPIFLRFIISNAETYYYVDSGLINTTSPLVNGYVINNFPLESVQIQGAATGGFQLGGPGGIKRLQAPNFERYYNEEPLMVRTLGLFRLASNVVVNFGYFL